MATPSLIASYEVLSPTADLTSLDTPAFTPNNGEVLIVKAASESFNNPDIGAASGGGQTFTSRVYEATSSNSVIRIHSAIVSGSPGSMTVSQAFGGTGGWRSIVVERWGSATLAGSPAVNSGVSTGAPSLTVTTVADGSVVSWVSADWNAVAPGTPAYRSSATQDGLHDKSGTTSYVAYFAYQVTTTAGTQTIGLTAPGSQQATIGGIEIQGVITTPTVTTQAVTELTVTTATGNGTVVADGGETITERGVCWSTSLNPTTSDSKATSAGTTGSYSVSITGLSNGTLYYARAYAINANGTSYGDNVTFRPYAVNVGWIRA
ncbi:MAG TPA: hypothetical protein VFO38_04810 [Candidatus Saccharimonadales bacterium]|nr:hypothetical protein [Candidatus Saccharimonadales bacterium]